jgi:hypothetical protein
LFGLGSNFDLKVFESLALNPNPCEKIEWIFFSMQPIILILNYSASTRFSPTGQLHFFTPHQAGLVGVWVQSSWPSSAACPFLPPRVK